MNSLRTSSSYNEPTAGNFRFATEGDLGTGGIKGASPEMDGYCPLWLRYIQESLVGDPEKTHTYPLQSNEQGAALLTPPVCA